jgi:hypothetical protein
MKRYLYYACFALLGLLIATLVHAGLEILALKIITNDMATYNDGYVWQHWNLVHGSLSLVLWLLGTFGGFVLGKHFWQVLYIEQRYGKPRW